MVVDVMGGKIYSLCHRHVKEAWGQLELDTVGDGGRWPASCQHFVNQATTGGEQQHQRTDWMAETAGPSALSRVCVVPVSQDDGKMGAGGVVGVVVVVVIVMEW